MTNPIETIGRGLDAHERAKNAPGTFKLAALAAAPATIAAISEITAKTAKARDRLHTLRAASIDAVQKHREKVTSEYANIGWTLNDSGTKTDDLGGTRRRKMMDDAAKAFRKDLNAATAEERATLLAEQRAAKETLDLVRRAWTSPVAILMRQTLGSEMRSVYAKNLEAAGPTELDNACHEAVTTGNKELAAACLTCFDSIGKESKKLVKFSKDDVAEALAGSDWRKAQEAIGLADFAIAQIELAEKEIQGKSLSPGDKIRIGMVKVDLEARVGKKFDDSGHALDADGKREGEPLQYTGKTSISESNRLWFARQGLDDMGGQNNG